MTDQYLVFPGADEPSTSAGGSVVVPPLTNRIDKLFQILDSIPNVDSDEDSEKDETTALVPLYNLNPSPLPPNQALLSEMADTLNNLDQLSFSLERLITEKLHEIDARENEIQEELMEIQKLVEVDRLPFNRNNVSCFGMPYFKTCDLRPFPPNDDHHIKMRNDELISHNLPSSTFWTTNEMHTLETAVKNEIIDREVEKLNLKLMETVDDVMKRKQEQLKLRGELSKKHISHLLTDDSQDFDWHKIATYNFRDRHPAEECGRMWHLYAKPTIIKRPWSKEEDNKLKEVAKANNYQDWELIAKALNTGRSGYQCFVQYRRRLAPINRLGKWTEEEDKLLCKIVENCRIGPYVPWSKVMYYFESRSLRQLFNRWTYSLNPSLKKGHFTQSEDFGLCVGISLYGKNFNKIASILGNRSAAQIRERYKAKMNNSNTGSWTKEEDMQLIELFKKYGDKKWYQISQHLARDRTQCRLRYKRLKNKYNFNLDIIKRNVHYKPLHRYEKEWFRQYFADGKDEKSLRAVSRNLSLIRKRGRKGKSGTAIENQLIDFFSESFSDTIHHSFKLLSVHDELKLKEAAEVIVQILKLLKANLCFPKNICENYIKSRDTNLLANDAMIQLILLVAEMYNAEEGTTSYNNFSVDAENDYAEVHDNDDIVEEKFIDYDPLKFVDRPINLERSFEQSFNQATMSSLIYGDTGTFYVEPQPLVTINRTPAVPAESVGFNLQQTQPRRKLPPEKPKPDSDCSTVKTQLDHLVPPNASSMIALRTYMLARRKLWKMIGKQHEVLERPKPSTSTNRNKLSASEAHDLAMKRFSSLLFWPLFLSAHNPAKFGIVKTPDDVDDVVNGRVNAKSGDESDGSVEEIFVKPEERYKRPKKNSVIYQRKLKQERKKVMLKRTAPKSCDNVRNIEFIDSNASPSTSDNDPKGSAGESTPRVTNDVDPLSMESLGSETPNIGTGTETKGATTKVPVKRRKRHTPGSELRRSGRVKQQKLDPEDLKVKEEQAEAVAMLD